MTSIEMTNSTKTKDDLVRACVGDISALAGEYLTYVRSLNPCAYSDRMVEGILSKAAELAKLYNGDAEGRTMR